MLATLQEKNSKDGISASRANLTEKKDFSAEIHRY